jgi:hypothetical protein
MKPARMIGVKLHRPFRYTQAVFPVTGIGDQIAEKSSGRAIHSIQRQCALRCRAKGQEIFLEE